MKTNAVPLPSAQANEQKYQPSPRHFSVAVPWEWKITVAKSCRAPGGESDLYSEQPAVGYRWCHYSAVWGSGNSHMDYTHTYNRRTQVCRYIWVRATLRCSSFQSLLGNNSSISNTTHVLYRQRFIYTPPRALLQFVLLICTLRSVAAHWVQRRVCTAARLCIVWVCRQ